MGVEFLWYIPNRSIPATAATTPRGPQQPRAPDRPRPTRGGPRLGRCAARHRLGPAGHVHRRHRAGRAYDDVPAADRDPAGLLAPGALRLRGGHARPAQPAGGVLVNIVVRPGQPRRLRRRRGRPGPAVRAGPGSSCSSSGGCGPRRTSRSAASTSGSTGVHGRAAPRRTRRRPHPRLYFGGASDGRRAGGGDRGRRPAVLGRAAGRHRRADRPARALSEELGREHAPLEFGLRITTLVRDTTEEAWRDAEAKVGGWRDRQAGDRGRPALADRGRASSGCWTWPRGARCWTPACTPRPGKFGGGGAGTTWLVGSADEVADALRRYAELGITHFVLSDTPYKTEAARVGDELLSLAARPGRCLRRTTTRWS